MTDLFKKKAPIQFYEELKEGRSVFLTFPDIRLTAFLSLSKAFCKDNQDKMYIIIRESTVYILYMMSLSLSYTNKEPLCLLQIYLFLS